MPDHNVTVDSVTLALPTAVQAVLDARVGGAITAARPNVQTFYVGGTWVKPVGVTVVRAFLITGGAGGGSGRQGAPGTVRCGGDGGNPGVVLDWMFNAATLAATVPVIVPPGAAGGAAVTTPDTNGNDGASATAWTKVGFGALYSLGPYYLYAGGKGGKATGSPTPVPQPTSTMPGGVGALANAVGIAGNASLTAALTPVGGGAGGGITTANTPSNGGVAGALYIVDYNGSLGGVVDGELPFPPDPNPSGILLGGGGPGGAASITKAAQAGANGTVYGGGGGGGGASANGFNSGAGGNGGPGIVQIACW